MVRDVLGPLFEGDQGVLPPLFLAILFWPPSFWDSSKCYVIKRLVDSTHPGAGGASPQRRRLAHEPIMRTLVLVALVATVFADDTDHLTLIHVRRSANKRTLEPKSWAR